MTVRAVAVIVLGLALGPPTFGATASVDDVDIYWISYGEGPAILFVHGWTCDTTVWAAQMAELANSYRVIALDLPGHGLSGSPANGQFTMDLYAKAVEAVRADAGAEEIVLVGHSMGAPVISQYALNYPDRVAGLVAVDGGLSPPDPASMPPLPEGPFRQVREQLIRGFFVPETKVQVQDQVLHVMLAPSDERATAVGSAMGTFSRVDGNRIDAPTLLVLAGTAEELDESDMEELRDIAPRAQIEVIENTGHFLMMEEPAVFNDMIEGFMRDLER